jgi:hypothetical protein
MNRQKFINGAHKNVTPSESTALQMSLRIFSVFRTTGNEAAAVQQVVLAMLSLA